MSDTKKSCYTCTHWQPDYERSKRPLYAPGPMGYCGVKLPFWVQFGSHDGETVQGDGENCESWRDYGDPCIIQVDISDGWGKSKAIIPALRAGVTGDVFSDIPRSNADGVIVSVLRGRTKRDVQLPVKRGDIVSLTEDARVIINGVPAE